ncbi:peroxiredoxin family protein [Oryzomonas sagensis]|nr:redoxin domain-containing protein [Oryzomonas sagensis]
MRFARHCCLLLAMLVLAGCGDNLFPSGEDKRPPVQPGSTGPSVGQRAPDFSVSDTSGATVTLASALAARKGIVLYFTMWCPVCDSHMDSIRGTMPSYPAVGFYAVDYVSGSVADAAGSAAANGFAGSFQVLADTGHVLLNNYQATMGTTVVIDSTGIIRMSEDYQNGSRFDAVLAALP